MLFYHIQVQRFWLIKWGYISGTVDSKDDVGKENN